jgi:low temperature requirement protein LtrA
MLAAMAAASVMAAAAPGAFGERAWAFSLANAAIRVVLLVLWLYQHRDQHRENSSETPWRIWIYNGGTAVLWLISAVLPLHIAVVLWAAAIVVEVGMVVVGARLWPDRSIGGINIEHASERLGLFVISDSWYWPSSAVRSSSTAPGPSPRGSSASRLGPISPGSFRPRCSYRFSWFRG